MARSGPVTKDASTVALGLAQIRVGAAHPNIASTTSVLTAANSIGALANTKFTGEAEYWKLESGFPMLEDLSIPIRESAKLECSFKEVTPFNLALARGLDPNLGGTKTVAVGGSNATLTTLTPIDQAGLKYGEGTVANKTYTITASGSPVDTFTITASGVTFDSGTNVGGVGEVIEAKVDDVVALRIEADALGLAASWASGDTLTVAFSSYSQPHSGSIGLGGLKAPEYLRMEAVYTYPNGTNHMYIVFPRANVTSSVEVDMQAEDNANVPIAFEAKRADSESAGGNAVWDAMPLGVIYFD